MALRVREFLWLASIWVFRQDCFFVAGFYQSTRWDLLFLAANCLRLRRFCSSLASSFRIAETYELKCSAQTQILLYLFVVCCSWSLHDWWRKSWELESKQRYSQQSHLLYSPALSKTYFWSLIPIDFVILPFLEWFFKRTLSHVEVNDIEGCSLAGLTLTIFRSLPLRNRSSSSFFQTKSCW